MHMALAKIGSTHFFNMKILAFFSGVGLGILHAIYVNTCLVGGSEHGNVSNDNEEALTWSWWW
jgi:hypothetical protein